MPRHTQPPHIPTQKSRERVAMLAGYGLLQPQIASIVGVSVPTLAKYYRNEMDLGVAQTSAAVGKSLFQMATDDKNVQAAIWWSKSRMGWREAARLPEEQPTQTTLKVEFRWADDTPMGLPIARHAASPEPAHEPPTIEGQAVSFREPETEARPPQKRSRRG